jgi:hypothetical protein
MLEADGFLHWNSSVVGLSALRELNVETVSLASGSRPREIDGFDLLWLSHLDCDLHTQLVAGSAEIGACQRSRLGGIARDCDTDEILAANQPIRRVELDAATEFHSLTQLEGSTSSPKSMANL